MLATSFMAPRIRRARKNGAGFPLLRQGDRLQRRFSMNGSADWRAQKLSTSMASVAARGHIRLAVIKAWYPPSSLVKVSDWL